MNTVNARIQWRHHDAIKSVIFKTHKADRNLVDRYSVCAGMIKMIWRHQWVQKGATSQFNYEETMSLNDLKVGI